MLQMLLVVLAIACCHYVGDYIFKNPGHDVCRHLASLWRYANGNAMTILVRTRPQSPKMI